MAQVWSNVQFKMEDSAQSPDTITSITKANPGVVTATSHGMSNGDIVVLSVQGMYQLDKRPVRIANVATNTFELEGINTTDYDTFTSGTATKVSLGTSFTTVGDISVSGGETEMIDVTTISDSQKQTIPGAASPTEVSGSVNWDPADAGQIALKAAADAKQEKTFLVQFANGYRWIFRGYAGFVGAPAGSAQGKVTSPFKVSAQGRSSMYAS